MISLNGETLQGHRLPVASSKQEDQHQQIVERQRKESVAFAIRKVGFSNLFKTYLSQKIQNSPLSRNRELH